MSLSIKIMNTQFAKRILSVFLSNNDRHFIGHLGCQTQSTTIATIDSVVCFDFIRQKNMSDNVTILRKCLWISLSAKRDDRLLLSKQFKIHYRLAAGLYSRSTCDSSRTPVFLVHGICLECHNISQRIGSIKYHLIRLNQMK